ncbi:hypothetical protein FRZ44_33060 [Hypericibacter terrae]|uniref:RNA-directed DNA polymerase n=1 Tax=Hypericibacter terrae TaxID=2602015 RepID=A0A5J6MK91_9PROT|nr:reverse transcriptase family protein [Hypericibacter terrae]QEX18002.1 hypothetical protein FRZ44_33060 [Hypericibacter terrae]
MSFKYDLTQLQNREQLINFLGLSKDVFEDVLDFDPTGSNFSQFSEKESSLIELPLFFRHEIPKKNRQRGYRTVWEPTFLKSPYKALARRLNNFFAHKLEGFPHAQTYGYISGRNIRENAQNHCGHTHLVSIDLEDFFPSIKASRIATFLRTTGITPTVADLVSRFVTIEGSLPLGLPTSPTIANAICLPMDIELEALAQKLGATFSRYADDISFSSDGTFPSLRELMACIRQHNFEIAEAKTRTSKLGQAHYVTGLSVSDPAQPHVPRKKKRRLRQELYYADKYGLDDHLHHVGLGNSRFAQQEINRLDGLVKFTAHHEPRLSAHLKTTWAKILQTSGHRPSFAPKNQHRLPFYIYIDEAEYARPSGDRLLALAMAVSQHQEQINRATQDLLETTLSDVWAAGNLDAIAKKGVHFSDATEDMRLAYIDRMRLLPFEGYVAMARLPSAADYEVVYLRLLNAMIKRRLMAAESQFANLVFEENSKVRQEAIRKTVTDTYDALRESNNRHPEYCSVEFAGKPNFGLSIPDFLLGVLGKYLTVGPQQDGKPAARYVLLFERLRDKYRLILDVDNWVEYTRRRPIIPW